MPANLAACRLAACGLPSAWAASRSWTVLDTDFQNGHQFLTTWLAWQRDTHRPAMLHYVGLCAVLPAFENSADGSNRDAVPQGSEDLARRCAGLGPGFHRMLLDHAHVSLTLCVGDVRALLGEHAFQADTVFTAEPHDKWAMLLLARRCKRGTRFCMYRAASGEKDAALARHQLARVQAAGFALDPPNPDIHAQTGTFNPRWDIPNRRSASHQVVVTPSTCAIIGAGIAGASVAHALALRGWRISVFDQEAQPANSTSGLPVGLAVPHVSADDNPRSRLSRSGIGLVMQHADALLNKGQDWEHSGVMEVRQGLPPRWHAQACWLKPASLVRAWLAHPGIVFTGSAKVAALVRDGDHWLLHDHRGQVLGRFALVVVANAGASAALLQQAPDGVRLGADLQDKLNSLQAVHGTLSLGTYAEVIDGLPTTPINGNGCFIPHLPGTQGAQWATGSSFETDAWLAADTQSQHAANMARLRQLVPLGEIDLADTLDRGPVWQWSATRCVTHDRLPLVGPIDTADASGAGLWLCVGMGARGLSFSALCAELLAARLGGEPLPMEFSLSRSLDCNRLRRRPAPLPLDSPALRPFAANP